MGIQTRSTQNINTSILSNDDFIITPSTTFDLLKLQGTKIFIQEVGVCSIKSFNIMIVPKVCGICLLGKWESATVLSKIFLEMPNNETKFIDRDSSNMKSILKNHHQATFLTAS